MYVTFQQQNYSKTLQNKCNKVIENISNIVSIKIYNIRKLISLARETLIKEKIKKIKKIECLTHQIQWLMKKNTKWEMFLQRPCSKRKTKKYKLSSIIF